MTDHRYVRIGSLLLGICLGWGLIGCGGDDSPTTPQPTAQWSADGITWTAPYATTGDYPSTLEYRKSGTMVELRGTANAGATHVLSGQVIGVLPEGYRPPAGETAFLLGPTWGWPATRPSGAMGAAGVLVRSDGSVQVKSVHAFDGEQQYLSFDGLRFSTVVATDGWTGTGMTWNAPYAADGTYPSSLQFKKNGDIVHLQGSANAGSTLVQSGQFIGTLPEGYRPTADSVILLCPTWGWPSGHGDGFIGSAGVFIFPDGQVQIKSVHQYDGQQQFLMLDGISFSTVAAGSGWTDTGIAWTSPYAATGLYPSALEYRPTGDQVELRGHANAGVTHVTSGQTVCTLPEGVRPPDTRFLLGATWGWPIGHSEGYIGSAGAYVLSDGQMWLITVHQYDGQQQFLNLDTNRFSTSD